MQLSPTTYQVAAPIKKSSVSILGTKKGDKVKSGEKTARATNETFLLLCGFGLIVGLAIIDRFDRDYEVEEEPRPKKPKAIEPIAKPVFKKIDSDEGEEGQGEEGEEEEVVEEESEETDESNSSMDSEKEDPYHRLRDVTFY